MDRQKQKKPNENTMHTVLSDEDGLRLDRWVKRHFPALTHGHLQKMLRTGQIRVDGGRVEASKRITTGQTVRVPPRLSTASPAFESKTSHKRPMRHPEKLAGMILYQDDDVVALNKPAGLAVQGGTGLKENLDDSLMSLSLDGFTRPKLVHRLDRDTSGILLVARNDFAAMKLAQAFRSRKTQKIYWAATAGVPSPEAGRIDVALAKRGQTMAVAETDADDGIKTATTLYRVVESVPDKMAFVVLWPLSGRTHQLRVHMAHAGTPIWKDPLYGLTKDAEEALGLRDMGLGDGLHLHARQLIIPHPRRGILDLVAPLGPMMKKTWRCMGFSEKVVADFDGL